MTPNRSGQHFTSTQRKANFDHERLYGTTPLALAPRPWQPGGGRDRLLLEQRLARRHG